MIRCNDGEVNKHYDVIIIGAGIAGVSTAHHLQTKGQKMLLLDKKGIAAETSYGNSGVIDTGYILPFAPPPFSKIPNILFGQYSPAHIRLPSGLKYIPWIFDYYLNSRSKKRIQNGLALRPLVENAVEEHKDLLKDTDGLKYISDFGRAKLYRSEQSFKSASNELKMLGACGVECEIFNASKFREIEPNLKPNYYKAVTCKSSARYTNPGKAIQAMGQGLLTKGGEFKKENVTRIYEEKDSWHVNDYTSNHVVICAGPWSNDVLKPLGHKFPIAIKRGYHKHFKSNGKFSHALVDVDAGYLICPMEQGIRITTGVEFASRDMLSNPVQIDQVLPKAKELVDINEPVDDEVWLGARPCMADSLPVIGQSDKHQGLWFNFGHGHVGLTAGPASGKLLAQIFSNEKTFCDPSPYSPNRF